MNSFGPVLIWPRFLVRLGRQILNAVCAEDFGESLCFAAAA